MKFAILCSAGGSAFFAAFDILKDLKIYAAENFILITDRACDAEKKAISRGIECKRISFESRSQFSVSVAEYLGKKEITAILMLYSRLVTEDIFLKFPTINIHPALLPSFKGMNAVGQALAFGAKFLGATLHLTTERMDDGAILGQVVSPLKNGTTRVQADRLSFLQKTYLILVALDAIRLKRIIVSQDGIIKFFPDNNKITSSANPCLETIELKMSFDRFQVSLGMTGAI